MPESAEEVYARVVAAVGTDGHLPMPPSGAWDIFPWEVVDGQIVPRALQPPSDEPSRGGESDEKPCGACTDGFAAEQVVWEDDVWVLTHPGAPSGLPIVLTLHPREHLDLGTLDDEQASQLGRITNRVVRIVENLPEIGRVHVNRWGDGGSHLHQMFFARTARLTNVLGSPAMEWDDILPPVAEEVWRADLAMVAQKLANWGGDARA